MRRYRTIWWSTTTALVALVCVGTLLAGPVASDLLLFACTTLVAVSASAVTAPASARDRRHVGRTAVLAGAVVVATSGLLALTPWLAVAAAVVVALTAPWSVEQVVSRLPARRAATTRRTTCVDAEAETRDELDARVDAVYLECLTTAELCWAWRQSYVRLHQGPAHWRLRVVAGRERYLDELHRRDPRGMTRWLDHGPRAASGPDRYLRG